MSGLVRTRVGDFKIEDAYSTNYIKNGDVKLISINDVLSNMRKIIVDEDKAKKIRNGVILDSFFEEDMAVIYDKEDNLIAIYQNMFQKKLNKT